MKKFLAIFLCIVFCTSVAYGVIYNEKAYHKVYKGKAQIRVQCPLKNKSYKYTIAWFDRTKNNKVKKATITIGKGKVTGYKTIKTVKGHKYVYSVNRGGYFEYMGSFKAK